MKQCKGKGDATSRNWYNSITWNSNCFFSVSRRSRDISYWILIASFSDSLTVNSDLASRVSLAHLREEGKKGKRSLSRNVRGIAANLRSVKRGSERWSIYFGRKWEFDPIPFRAREAARSRVKSPSSIRRLIRSRNSRNFRTDGIYFGAWNNHADESNTINLGNERFLLRDRRPTYC